MTLTLKVTERSMSNSSGEHACKVVKGTKDSLKSYPAKGQDQICLR